MKAIEQPYSLVHGLSYRCKEYMRYIENTLRCLALLFMVCENLLAFQLAVASCQSPAPGIQYGVL